jgi:hypothetical protein
VDQSPRRVRAATPVPAGVSLSGDPAGGQRGHGCEGDGVAEVLAGVEPARGEARIVASAVHSGCDCGHERDRRTQSDQHESGQDGGQSAASGQAAEDKKPGGLQEQARHRRVPATDVGGEPGREWAGSNARNGEGQVGRSGDHGPEPLHSL